MKVKIISLQRNKGSNAGEAINFFHHLCFLNHVCKNVVFFSIRQYEKALFILTSALRSVHSMFIFILIPEGFILFFRLLCIRIIDKGFEYLPVLRRTLDAVVFKQV